MGDGKRFDQKMHMYFQPEWNPACKHLSREKKYLSLDKRLLQDIPGFTRLDYALTAGAAAVLNALQIEPNRANGAGNSWTGKGASGEKWDAGPPTCAQVLKTAALLYGADDIGFCRLNRNWVYSHYYDPDRKKSFPVIFSDEEGAEDADALVIPAEAGNVVVIVVEMDADAIETAPALPQVAATAVGYSRLAALVVALAEFIRCLGYTAIPSLNCTALNIPLAIDAGLGRLGRHGLLIHPRFGPRCRIAKILTDMPLPAGDPNPSDYLHDFCSRCRRCAVRCPAQAISFGEPDLEAKGDFSLAGYQKWHVDYAKCREYWVKSGTNCGVCIAHCTFSRIGRKGPATDPGEYWRPKLSGENNG